ncbi:MAG: thiamine phosphate synthase [Peptococcaceae bacterium]|jgi:thiamine-phosphate pyrophosphorylase|nr:thiamine phosphate synthase [Peptococcaceae bacterium]
MNQADWTLYLVSNSDQMDEDQFLQKIEWALQAGVTLLQLREKEKDGRALYELALKVNAIARAYQVPLLIDDRLDVALAVGAAGVHVGRQDIPVAVARGLLGPDKLVGATAKTVEQALAAQAAGADYLGVGAIYPTTTKVKTVPTSPATLKEICQAVRIPVIAIGGLNQGNLGVLRDSGCSGIAVVSAIMQSADTAAAVKELKTAAAAVLKGRGEKIC